jgi:hypothetical protein
MGNGELLFFGWGGRSRACPLTLPLPPPGVCLFVYLFGLCGGFEKWGNLLKASFFFFLLSGRGEEGVSRESYYHFDAFGSSFHDWTCLRGLLGRISACLSIYPSTRVSKRSRRMECFQARTIRRVLQDKGVEWKTLQFAFYYF